MHQPLVYSTSALLAACIGFSAPVANAQDGSEPQVINAFEDESLPEGQGVEVGTTGEISITVVDLDVTKVLQLLSMQSQRNIVASKTVTGELSASLTDVDFYEALDAILTPNGFGYIERGSFIYVYTADELAEMEEATRVPVYEVLTLNYISAADASAFITPLLSERGVVTASADPGAGIEPSNGDAGANTFANLETLMIRDYEENVEEVKTVLAQLDKRPPQVKIEATILEATLTDENRFGIDFALFSNLDFNQFFGPLAALGSGGTGNAIGDQLESTAGVSSDGSGVKVGVTGKNGSLLVNALDKITDTTVLANPQILVLNRQRARLQVGANIGYVTTTRTDVSDSETVEFLETGTTLNVRPFVSSDDFIRMELTPNVSNGSIDNSTGTTIPSETLQTLTTNVIVKSGQTVVLGGLFKEDTSVGRTQLPWAGDVPVVGLLGSNRNTETTRNEVIFMIRPTIMKDEALFASAEDALKQTQKVQVGSRNALLPFSRSAMVQGHLKNAYEALDAGDTDKAKWYVDLALYINPILPEAIELREELTGEKIFFRDSSILEDLVDTVVEEQAGALPPAPVAPVTPVTHEPLEDSAETEPVVAEDAVAAPSDETAEAPEAASDAPEADAVAAMHTPTEDTPAEEAEATEPVEATQAVEAAEPTSTDSATVSGTLAAPQADEAPESSETPETNAEAVPAVVDEAQAAEPETGVETESFIELFEPAAESEAVESEAAEATEAQDVLATEEEDSFVSLTAFLFQQAQAENAETESTEATEQDAETEASADADATESAQAETDPEAAEASETEASD